MRKHIHILLLRLWAMLLTGLWLCSSCIDEFTADIASTGDTYLVVEGSICSNSTCTFLLSRSLSLSPTADEIINRKITDARVCVVGTDQIRYNAQSAAPGTYTVEVGQLSPAEKYWLEIHWEDRVYESEPTVPLSTPAIMDLHFEQPREDKQVEIIITPEAPKNGEIQYFSWSYVEDWEIQTPYVSEWDYDLEAKKVIPAPMLLYRGWCRATNNPSIIINNSDYINGEIRDFSLYTLENKDDRFNRLYCTTITQRAISREEYEYERLSQRQSDGMGGLFTPQPSELPTNIHCKQGSGGAIGYVGVSLNTHTQRLFVSSSDVGYRLRRIPQIPDDNMLSKYSNTELYQMSFRILDYDDLTRQITWIERWAVDCRVWGADFIRPDFWPL